MYWNKLNLLPWNKFPWKFLNSILSHYSSTRSYFGWKLSNYTIDIDRYFCQENVFFSLQRYWTKKNSSFLTRSLRNERCSLSWHRLMKTKKTFERTREQISARPRTKVDGCTCSRLESSHKYLQGLHKPVQTRKSSFISFIK